MSMHLSFASVSARTFAAGLVAKILAPAMLAIPAPEVKDPRLELSLFAAEPEIVTPIGLVVDSRNRVFVVESHTHMPPRNYPGPKSDHIKIFQDTNGDGKADRITTFAEGFHDAMNLAFSPEGILYVVCAREVYALYDESGDGFSDGRKKVLELITEERYAHNSLLGITFSHDGWIYISRGNTGGHPYTFRGTDGSSVSGHGDGGSIIRCRPDGSQVQFVATGFWNAFDLKFDYAGRLLAVDNDPDSRGPNRLLHIVEQGDYGFKARYGGSGLHPFQAWEGEIPGTLPMIAGTGEAPSGLLDLSRAALPLEYHRDILVTIWGEHTIARYRTTPDGVSLKGRGEILIAGGQNFRPVAIDAAPDGTIYITDWVLRDYPNHGQGRIWKLTTRPGIETLKPRSLAQPLPDPAFQKFEKLIRTDAVEEYPQLERTLRSEDPFLRHAAVAALARPVYREQIKQALESPDAAIRLGALLALRRAGYEKPELLLESLLADPDLEIRRMALIWTAERSLTGLRPKLDLAISQGEASPVLFETYLAAVQDLGPDMLEAYSKKMRGFQIRRQYDPQWVEEIVHDAARPALVRTLALSRLSNLDTERNVALLRELTGVEHEPRLRMEAVRTLAHSRHSEAAPVLKAIAANRERETDERAEAVLALSSQSPGMIQDLMDLLDDPDLAVRIEFARALRLTGAAKAVAPALKERYKKTRSDEPKAGFAEQLELALFSAKPGLDSALPRFPRPADHDEWRETLMGRAEEGDAASGRRLFFSSLSACSQCHRVEGRGGTTGPDLTYIARSAHREQLIQSILRPSDDVAPQFQGWEVETFEGVYTGIQMHHKSGGAIDLILLDGRTVRFPGESIVSYAAMTISLMPEGLEEAMAVHDFLDLLAFLESLK
jgi:putative membrane-bound dehydrogenase-like protein